MMSWFYPPTRSSPLPSDPLSRRVLAWIFLTLLSYGALGLMAGYVWHEAGGIPILGWLGLVILPPILGGVMVPAMEFTTRAISDRLVGDVRVSPVGAPATGMSATIWKWIERFIVFALWLLVLTPGFLVMAVGGMRLWMYRDFTVSWVGTTILQSALALGMLGLAGLAGTIGSSLVYGIDHDSPAGPELRLKRIRVLLRLGRRDEAWAEAESLNVEYPDSVEVDRARLEIARDDKGTN